MAQYTTAQLRARLQDPGFVSVVRACIAQYPPEYHQDLTLFPDWLDALAHSDSQALDDLCRDFGAEQEHCAAIEAAEYAAFVERERARPRYDRHRDSQIDALRGPWISAKRWTVEGQSASSILESLE